MQVVITLQYDVLCSTKPYNFNFVIRIGAVQTKKPHEVGATPPVRPVAPAATAAAAAVPSVPAAAVITA